ncbi:unnamed protein product [Polarella glacialis]|uniref:Uncharacterized protein n=1 Tax=Polarella glacialis TaxID=89957 RepID=A0A813DUE8_POLGL|nr:unnamed protein product [Polarella glacialis]|mmetsp:Transcript_24990/g.44428  ORF Transcript_24990/g.44428 Transcript_24990/m.44428 type:complete len:115 (-) Transcript_24990:45-389(-)
MPIDAEQFATTLENMTRAWESVPEDDRQPKDEEKSFFEDMRPTCAEMIQRWHSGESSHADASDLAAEYSADEAGINRLMKDLFAIKSDPFVQAADLKLSIIKFTAPSRPRPPPQ